MIGEDTRSIAELWFELCRANRPVDLIMKNSHEEDLEAMEAAMESRKCLLSNLMAELLDRCWRIEDADGCATIFRINGTTVQSWNVDAKNNPITIREDNATTARNLAAAISFWTWELEQREKEASNG